MSWRPGVSVVEVLVAVAIVGLALVPLVSIQSQIARTHARYIETYERATDQRNALALLAELNPMADPRGARDLGGGAVLRWQSTALTPVKRSAGYPVDDGPFDVALYRVAAQIERADRAAVPMDVELLGWRRVVAVTGADLGAARPGQSPFPPGFVP